MPEYLSPGVYVEEFEIGPKPIEGVSTSTAACLGKTERGPLQPRLVTSFMNFQRLYGGYITDSYVTYAISGFFDNGGQRCYIFRIVGDGATTAEQDITPSIKVKAVGPGEWGENISVIVEDASLVNYDASPPQNADLFKLTVTYTKPDGSQLNEIYDNLSPKSSSSSNIEKQINDISAYIEIVRDGDSEERPTNSVFNLVGGGDGADITVDDYKGDPDAEPGEKSGLYALEEKDDVALLFAPDEDSYEGLTAAIIEHCENQENRFAISAANQSAGPVGKLRPPKDSQYAAFYYPWIKILDPVTNLNKLVPPVGQVTGIYARTDTNRGVHKAPANETVRTATDLQFQVVKGEQDVLNPRGVNVIRSFNGRGIRVWGARTMSSDPLWKYINVRRLFIFLKESIKRGTQWVVFEPNDEKLWARVRQTISGFLTTVWRDGALMGTTVEEAYFVKCDRSTMTQADLDNGRLICVIGVAPVKPAEFVIFRIAQWTAGAEGA